MNKSDLAFDDIRDAFDQALMTDKGIRIVCSTRGAAIQLRSRFNYLRKLSRMDSQRVYPSDNPMYGRSPYDKLVLRIPTKFSKDDNVLFIEPRSVDSFNIEIII